jgi:hypothetical protein
MARRIMRRFKLAEVSAVDRPAQEHALALIFKREDAGAPYWKREFTAEQRREAASSGAAEPDGSYPIHNASDLHNAMRAIGRSKNPAKTRAHIRARARALGLTSELSDAFKRSDDMADDPATKVMGLFLGERLAKARDAFLASVKSILGDENANKDELVDKTVDQFVDHVADLSADSIKALSGGDPDDPPSEDEMNVAAMKKVLGLADNATEQDVIATVTKLAAAETHADKGKIAKLEKDLADANKAATVAAELAKADFSETERAFYNNLSDDAAKESFRKADHAGRMTQMEKREPELLELAKKVAENEALRKRVEKLEEDKALAEFTKEAIDAGLPESEGRTWMLMAKNAKSPEEKAAVAKMKGHLKSAIAAAKEGGLFKEFGATGRAEPLSAYEELEAKAAELRKVDPKLSKSQAFAKVYADPENAKLAQRERAENRPAGAAA